MQESNAGRWQSWDLSPDSTALSPLTTHTWAPLCGPSQGRKVGVCCSSSGTCSPPPTQGDSKKQNLSLYPLHPKGMCKPRTRKGSSDFYVPVNA